MMEFLNGTAWIIHDGENGYTILHLIQVEPLKALHTVIIAGTCFAYYA